MSKFKLEVLQRVYTGLRLGLQLEKCGNTLAFTMQQPTPALGEDVERPFTGTNYIDYDETHYFSKEQMLD